jgi:hypothetical protein
MIRRRSPFDVQFLYRIASLILSSGRNSHHALYGNPWDLPSWPWGRKRRYSPYWTVDWTRVALTREEDANDTSGESVIMMGAISEVLPSTGCRALQTLKHKLLLRDFPHREPGAVKADRFDVVLEQMNLVDERLQGAQAAL